MSLKVQFSELRSIRHHSVHKILKRHIDTILRIFILKYRDNRIYVSSQKDRTYKCKYCSSEENTFPFTSSPQMQGRFPQYNSNISALHGDGFPEKVLQLCCGKGKVPEKMLWLCSCLGKFIQSRC